MDRFNKLKEIQKELIELKNNFEKETDLSKKVELKNKFISFKDVEIEHLYLIISELTQEKLNLLEDIKMLNIEADKHYNQMLKYKNIIETNGLEIDKRESN